MSWCTCSLGTRPKWRLRMVRLAKNLREAEAEAIALICCDSLNLSGAEFCRGYIREWLGVGNPVSETSARRIFRAAKEILRAGSVSVSETD